ncbi:MAG TPA: adenylate/guanylate cyclase domain-containing protein [Arenimonas sp.]|nr:adenylate/guanylate cyclase domain-containing protein [Arenimonas sp.]
MSQKRPQTILFADVSGSTRLFEMRGDVEARRLIAMVLDALGDICRQHGGRVIKTIGDEIMCSLPGPMNGVLAACDMQRKLARDINFVRENLAIRVGLQHGDALDEADGDVFGDAVNVAARMAALAKREQIVTTAATMGQVSGKAPEFRSLGKARVAGKLLPIEIVDVVWQEDTSGMTMVQSAIRISDIAAAQEVHVPQKLTLKYRGETIELAETSEPFMMGREAGNHLAIEADWVSRSHALIEYKRGHFVLSDRSTNGTFLRIGQDDELRLHRDETQMRKSGVISLGKASALNPEHLVHYELS